MILSTPFSRQNKNYQSWNPTGNSATTIIDHNNNNSGNHSNGTLVRRPAPEQPAPEQPRLLANGFARNQFRSNTMSRLDMKRARPPTATRAQLGSLPRNQSSLGYSRLANQDHAIYAPASIASPQEYSAYKNRQQQLESQHYATASCYDYKTNYSSGRSGRESALSNLLEKFGTFRRKAKQKLISSSSRANSSAKLSPIYQQPTQQQHQVNSTAPLPFKETSLDPEIYASGKREVLAEEIYAEGLRAIDGNGLKRLLEYEIDEQLMAEGEVRVLLDNESKLQPAYQCLVRNLINWINDELAQQRYIINDLQEDLYDGLILGKLIEKLHNIRLDLIEVTQNEALQKHKLKIVLSTINRILTIQARNWAQIGWSAEGIHSKNMVQILQLLITLARFYRAPMKLPTHLSVLVHIIQKHQSQLYKRSQEIQLTSASEDQFPRYNELQAAKTLPEAATEPTGTTTSGTTRDVFDTLVDYAPDKLMVVKRSLIRFVSRHLNKINLSCNLITNNRTRLDTAHETLDAEQFSDGLLLVFLIASLEDYFVPLGNLFTSSTGVMEDDSRFEQQSTIDFNNNLSQIDKTALEETSYVNTQPIYKLHNVNVALTLIEEAGIMIRAKVRAEDIVNADLKSLLRVLYALFSRYRHL